MTGHDSAGSVRALAMSVLGLVLLGGAAFAGCLIAGPPATRSSTTLPAVTSTSAPVTSTSPPSTTSTAIPPTTSTSPTTTPTTTSLGPGASGPAVVALQQRLTALGYWVGTANGTFGDTTEQAVYALQKAAGLSRDGIAGPQTMAALDAGVVPTPRPAEGYVIEVDLSDDLLMVVTGTTLRWTLNTSTGGGYVFTGDQLAVTPPGLYHIFREVDGWVIDNLGTLWRPKYFDEGIALHGETDVPPVPVSHGCVRVSIDAMNWIWTSDVAPIGTAVWVFT